MLKLIFERSQANNTCFKLDDIDLKSYKLNDKYLRNEKPALAEVSEVELVRHYRSYAKYTFGVDDGFYPLGSCTMKYNPKVNEVTASLEGFSEVHPLQEEEDIQGCLKVYYEAEKALCEVTGMDRMSFQASAGAHGEFTAMAMMKAYFAEKGETNRKKIIVPDSAHGTNPASAAMCGFEVVSVESKDGRVDLDKLKEVLNEEVAGLMLTNPNTLGIYDEGILEITRLVHEVGGLVYYDGANLNAIMGISRPGDMGFDCLHLNLHKTFSTPHGGGGPGAGAIGAKGELAAYLPNPGVVLEDDKYHKLTNDNSIGNVRNTMGNFSVVVKALTYIKVLGGDGLKQASENAVLNANYLMNNLQDKYKVVTSFPCMHEFVMDLSELKEETGVSAMDVAKRLIDYGIHPPTMYFPLIVHEALMFEPTETETKETLDNCISVMKQIYEEAHSGVDLHNAPLTTEFSRPDEVQAARNPILRYHHD